MVQWVCTNADVLLQAVRLVTVRNAGLVVLSQLQIFIGSCADLGRCTAVKQLG